MVMILTTDAILVKSGNRGQLQFISVSLIQIHRHSRYIKKPPALKDNSDDFICHIRLAGQDSFRTFG